MSGFFRFGIYTFSGRVSEKVARKVPGFAIVAALLHLGGLVSPVWSQVVQTSLLSGRVFDPSSAVIPQAEVTLRGPFLLDGERRTMTDERGRYRFPALLPGTYRLTASSAGFAPRERSDIVVDVGEDRSFDFVLPVGARTEEVTVAQRMPAVDVRASAIPMHLDQNLLNDLPVSRELDDLINLAPGVTRDVAFGGTQSSNAIYINGVQTTDPQDQSPLVGLNHNWLEQMEVAALGAGAEYGGFTGVAANGTQPGWLSDNSPFEPREIVSLWESSGQTGGPIIEDRLWFFAGAEFSKVEDRPALFSGPGSTTNDRSGIIARLDAALSDEIHVDTLYRYAHADSTGVGLGPFFALEATQNVVDANHLWNARASWAVTARTLVEARTGGYGRVRSSNPRPPNSRLGPPATFFGGVFTGSALTFGDNDRFRADAAVRGGPRNSDRLLRWDPDHREGVWNVPKETELPG